MSRIFRNIKYNLVIVLTICFTPSLSQSIFPTGLKPYAAQLHVHGLSNHNGNDQPACMQWHSFYSDSTQTPILWFTDHREVFTQEEICSFTFKNGVYNASNFTVSGVKAPTINHPNKWVGVNTGGTVTVGLNDTSINIGMKADASTTFRTIYFSPRKDSKLLNGSRKFVRPLTSHPIITFDLNTIGLKASGKGHIQFILLMSYHYYNGVPKEQTIVYNFVHNSIPYSRTLTDSSTLMVNIPVGNNKTNHLLLDLAADAGLLKDGIDNTTNDCRLLVEAKQSIELSAQFSNITYYSLDTFAYSQYLIYKGLGNGYGKRYGINEYIGCEWSDENHMNGFLPDSATNRAVLYEDSTKVYGEQYFSDQVHARGGVVSFNHPFGPTGNLDSQTMQDYRTDTMAQYLLNNNAFGADMLEVGYTSRGGADIDHHLKLWDILTANQLYLYGDGVSDSHGGTWYSQGNNFVTWIWAQDSTPGKLINGLKAGKSFFGSNQKFTGNEFYFKVGNGTMGSRVAPTKRTAPVKVQVTDLPPNSEFRLTQGFIQPGLIVNYVYHDFVFDTANPPCLSLEAPCFIRVAVYNAGKPLLFSNPIVFTSGASQNALTNCILPVLRKSVMDDGEFEIYPNPVQKSFVLHAVIRVSTNIKISLMNSSGQIIKFLENCHAVAGSNYYDLEIKRFPAGSYFLLVENEYSKVSLPFVIKN